MKYTLMPVAHLFHDIRNIDSFEVLIPYTWNKSVICYFFNSFILSLHVTLIKFRLCRTRKFILIRFTLNKLLRNQFFISLNI